MFFSSSSGYSNYQTYEITPIAESKNVDVCLGGFSGSDSNYSMYKSNCFDLMKERCSVEWDDKCDQYVKNTNPKEEELFKSSITQQKTPMSMTTSCYQSINPMIPNQRVQYGINPQYYHGIPVPVSCYNSTSQVQSLVTKVDEPNQQALREQELNMNYDQEQQSIKQQLLQKQQFEAQRLASIEEDKIRSMEEAKMREDRIRDEQIELQRKLLEKEEARRKEEERRINRIEEEEERIRIIMEEEDKKRRILEQERIQNEIEKGKLEEREQRRVEEESREKQEVEKEAGRIADRFSIPDMPDENDFYKSMLNPTGDCNTSCDVSKLLHQA
jgi:hypothetical protein